MSALGVVLENSLVRCKCIIFSVLSVFLVFCWCIDCLFIDFLIVVCRRDKKHSKEFRGREHIKHAKCMLAVSFDT